MSDPQANAAHAAQAQAGQAQQQAAHTAQLGGNSPYVATAQSHVEDVDLGDLKPSDSYVAPEEKPPGTVCRLCLAICLLMIVLAFSVTAVATREWYRVHAVGVLPNGRGVAVDLKQSVHGAVSVRVTSDITFQGRLISATSWFGMKISQSDTVVVYNLWRERADCSTTCDLITPALVYSNDTNLPFKINSLSCGDASTISDDAGGALRVWQHYTLCDIAKVTFAFMIAAMFTAMVAIILCFIIIFQRNRPRKGPIAVAAVLTALTVCFLVVAVTVYGSKVANPFRASWVDIGLLSFRSVDTYNQQRLDCRGSWGSFGFSWWLAAVSTALGLFAFLVMLKEINARNTYDRVDLSRVNDEIVIPDRSFPAKKHSAPSRPASDHYDSYQRRPQSSGYDNDGYHHDPRHQDPRQSGGYPPAGYAPSNEQPYRAPSYGPRGGRGGRRPNDPYGNNHPSGTHSPVWGDQQGQWPGPRPYGHHDPRNRNSAGYNDHTYANPHMGRTGGSYPTHGSPQHTYNNPRQSPPRQHLSPPAQLATPIRNYNNDNFQGLDAYQDYQL